MTIFAKAYGIKVKCYWEHTREHVGRMDQHNWTYRELIENLMEQSGNTLEQKENEKLLQHPHPKKKVEAIGVHDAPSH